jgi:hypothetical protein
MAGFVVENGQDGGPFHVAAALYHDEADVDAVMEKCKGALTAKGWQVGPDTGPDFQKQILVRWSLTS